jgi:predicted dinucleotide-binding enzyme
MGWENFVNSDYNGIQADAFYCGDESSRETAERLISEVGVNPVYLGDPVKADAVDSFLGVFFALAMEQKRGRLLAFKLITRDSF